VNPVHTTGIEDLKAALRRSAWLMVALILFSIAAMNLVKQLAGPEYRASARVILSTSDLAANLAGIQDPYVDPQRKDDAERNLASSPQLYTYTADRTQGALGTGADLRSATSVGVSNNVVSFSAKAPTGQRAVALSNAVASAYPSWRAQVSARTIDTAIAQLRARIASVGRTPTLTDQLQRLLVLKTLNSGDTLFVERATGAAKTTPKPTKDSLLGLAIGLVVGLLVLGIRELLDTTVRTEADVESALGVPVLAAVHSIPRRIRASVIRGDHSQFSDEYGLLAANVVQMFEGHPGTVYIAVTSALPGEGKTTTAVNLAAALARRGSSIVLADFDLRKPALSGFFGIPRNAPGVNELLSGVVGVNSTLWSITLNGDRSRARSAIAEMASMRPARVTAGGRGTLTVLPGGGGLSKPVTSGFARLPSLLSEIEHEADFVVIDTPPALLVAGMAELGQRVDAALVVVRQGAVTRRRLRALSRQAGSWNARVLGAVFNDAPPEDGYGYEGYYNRA
jgi:Mrp family chromosome partitioning ATPase/capsular polysaccharide biosynthesis protein